MDSYRPSRKHLSARALPEVISVVALTVLSAGCVPEDEEGVPRAISPPAVGPPAATQPEPVSRSMSSIGRLMWAESTSASVAAIFVNGWRYEIGGATIRIDGNPATAGQLDEGDVVRVEGRGPRTWQGTATWIESTHVVMGPIESVDISNGSLVVMGQTVRNLPHTVYAEGIDPRLLAVGNALTVSGYRMRNGEIVATRIETGTGASFRTTGAITDVSNDRAQFTLNDLVVDYGAATVVGGTSGELRKGVFVDVEGNGPAAGGTLAAARISIRDRNLPGGPYEGIDIEGYVTAQDQADPTRFEVGGIALTTAPENVGQIVFDRMVEIGPERIIAEPSVPTQIYWKAGNVLPSMPRRLRGRIFDAVTGPIPLQYVDISMFLQDGSRHWLEKRSDANGQFDVVAPDNAHLLVLTWRADYVQPCSVYADTSAVDAFDVELVHKARLDADNPPPPVSSTGASIMTGIVYEQTGAGRLPVAGAFVTYSTDPTPGDGYTLASTWSDRNGRYLLCGLSELSHLSDPSGSGWPLTMMASKPGYRMFTQVFPPGSPTFDIELKR